MGYQLIVPRGDQNDALGGCIGQKARVGLTTDIPKNFLKEITTRIYEEELLSLLSSPTESLDFFI